MSPESVTQDELRRLFEYRDGWLYWRVKSAKRIQIGDRAGCPNGKGYRGIQVRGRLYKAHRLIFMWHHGYMPPDVDHINCDREDDRIENLRAATRSQNLMNAQTRRNNTSGVKGVCWHRSSQRWYASCRVNGRQTYVGSFKDIDAAVIAVRTFREKHHGEFTNHGGA